MEKKILVVDDNRLSREINCSTLEGAGYKTIMASDGNEGLSLLKDRKNRPDYIRSDYARA